MIEQELAILGGSPSVSMRNEFRWPVVTRKLEKHVLAALRSGSLAYTESSVTRRFEEAFADYHGRRFAIATNSGTSALLLAFFACGLGARRWRGGAAIRDGRWPPEVIVPAYGFFATVSPLLYLGIRPVFCDVEPDTGNLDPQQVESRITPRTRAIVVTHIGGHPAEMERFCEMAERHGLDLIEDCSHAHGARYRGRRVGTFGRAAAFSFQAGKMMSGGEGGILLTDDREVLERAAMLANFRRLHGLDGRPTGWLEDTGLGLKLRMGPLSAAMAHYHLLNLDWMIAKRRSSLDYLTRRLLASQQNVMSPPVTRPGMTRGAYYEYRVRVSSEVLKKLPLRALKAALIAEGVAIPHSNTRAIHELPLLRMTLKSSLIRLFASTSMRSEDTCTASMPVADALERETFVLPTFTGENRRLLDQYVQAVSKVCTGMRVLVEAYMADAKRFR